MKYIQFASMDKHVNLTEVYGTRFYMYCLYYKIAFTYFHGYESKDSSKM